MKRRNYIALLIIALQSTFLPGRTAFSQGLDASPSGVMISHGHPKGAWMASYSYMNMHMENNLSGTEKVSDDEIFADDYSMSPQKMNTDMHMLMLMYGLTGRLSFMLMANYTGQSMDMKSFTAHDHSGSTPPSLYHTHSTSGLGDVKLWALYKLLNGERSSLVFSAGLNLPTGNYQIEAGEHSTFEGEHQSYMMQLGTGSYDLMPGITYLKRNGKLTWSAQALSVIRPFDNALGYHYGNELTVNAWATYQFIPLLSASLRTEGYTSDVIYGKDDMIYTYSEPAANPDNYGGIRACAYAGINFYINKGFMRDTKFGIEYGMPYYQNLNGPQLSMQSMLSAGLTKSF